MATVPRTQLRAPSDGSRTITLDPAQPQGEVQPEAGPSRPAGVLRLRGLPPRDAPRVQWDEEVVDNEHLGRKKSKICCIYHKPRAFDESSSSSSGSSDDEGGEDPADRKEGAENPQGQAMHPHGRKRKYPRPKCRGDCDHSDEALPSGPNAYEHK